MTADKPSGATGAWGFFGRHVHVWITAAYFVWAAWELVRLLTGARRATALPEFARMWREHVARRG